MGKLADLIRQKHPGAYGNVDDATLEKQVLAKYPQYQSLVEPEKPAATAPAPEERSVGGFLGNVLPSVGRLLKDTATGAVDLGKMAGAGLRATADPIYRMQLGGKIIQGAPHVPQMVREAGGALKDRYGSLENIKRTAYEDPAGILADIAGVATLGAGAAARTAPRISGQLRKIESKINPLRVAEIPAPIVEYGAAAAVRPLLGPTRGQIRQTRAPLEIERTALREGAVTERGATQKLRAASGRTTKAAAEATASGTTVPRSQVAQFPKTLDKTERLTPNVRELDDLAALEREVTASLPAHITPTELLERRRSLDAATNAAYRAQDRGGYIRSTRDIGQKELGSNMREALRDVAPSVRESDDLARRLALVKDALENANTRPKGIPMSAALATAGGGYFAGGPAAGALGAGIGIGRTFPQIPLALGSIPVRGTAAVAGATRNPASRQGLLLAALLERMKADERR